MKKAIPYLLTGVLAIGIVHQLYVYFSEDSNNAAVIPPIDISLLDGSEAKVSELGKDKHTLVFLFKSDCDFCKQEMRSIRDVLDEFKGAELIFLSLEGVKKIETFRAKFFPEQRDFVTFGRASLEDFEPLLEQELGYPYLLWYDSDGYQKTQHRGLFPVQKVLDIIATD